MWLRSDGARRGCAVLLAAPLLLALLLAGERPARAEAPARVMTERAGFSFDVRLGAGGARAEFTESDRAVASFNAVAVSGALRFGWFLSEHWLLGAEVSGGWYGGVGTPRVHDTAYFQRDGAPSEASYGLLAPLGLFVELYPFATQGWFASVAGGVGLMQLPAFAGKAGGGLLSGYSLELGYEPSRVAKLGPAAFLRYSRWAGEESPFGSEQPDGLVSRELLLGVRWSFWTPEWGPPAAE